MSFVEQSTKDKNVERTLSFRCAACGAEFVWAYAEEFKTGVEAHYDGWAICYNTPDSGPNCEWCTAFSVGAIEGYMLSEGHSDGSYSYKVMKSLEGNEDAVRQVLRMMAMMNQSGGECND